MRSIRPPVPCQVNLIFPWVDQGRLLILKKATNSLLGQVHYAKCVPDAILLRTILLLHGWACSLLQRPEAALPLFLPGDDSGIYFLPYYQVEAIAHHGSKAISEHLRSFQANSHYISSTKHMNYFFFLIYDCGNNSTWVTRGWTWTFATPRAEQCSYHCFTALVSLFL